MKMNTGYIDTLAERAKESNLASRLAVKNGVAAGVIRIDGHGLASDLEQVRRKAERIQERVALRIEWLAEHPAAIGFVDGWKMGLERRDAAMLEAAWSHAEAQVRQYDHTGWIGRAPNERK